jgi:hypothetical protein
MNIFTTITESDCKLLRHIITSAIKCKKTNNKFLEYVVRENYKRCNPTLLKSLYLSVPLPYDDMSRNTFLYSFYYFETSDIDIFLRDMGNLRGRLRYISTRIANQ